MVAIDGEVYQATLSQELEGGSACLNTFHFRVEGPAGSSASDVELASEVAGFLTEIFDGLISGLSDGGSTPIFSLDQVAWVVDHWAVIRNVTTEVITAVKGTSAGDPLPAGVASLMRMVPIYARRAGRKFIGALTKAVIDTDGSNTSSWMTALTGAAPAFLTSRTLTGTPSNLALDYIVLVREFEGFNLPLEVEISDDPAYQRRRKRAVGL